MPSNYTGNPLASQSPSPAPSPGGQLIQQQPVDGDTGSAASVDQSFKVTADYVNYIQKAVALSPPNTQSGNAPGFTAVTHVGTGSGTITPSGTGWSGLNIKVVMITGGAVGAATFQYSTDGGNTYSGTVTTSAAYAVGSTGVVLSFFGGTFVAADTYQFQQTLTPLALFRDAAAIGRFIVDHNGIDTGGRITRIDETFDVMTNAYVNASPFTNYPKLVFARVGTTFNYITGMWLGQRTCGIQTGANTSGDSGYVMTNSYYMTLGTGSLGKSIYTMESEVYIGGGSSDIFTGFNDQTGLAQNANNCIGVRAQLASSSVWHFITTKASVPNDITTAVSITTGAWTRLKFEFHESGTALALAFSATNGVALVFINDVLAAMSTTSLPTASMTWVFGSQAPALHLSENNYWSTWSWRQYRNQSATGSVV